MQILILSAMEEEIDFLVSSFKPKLIDKINNQNLYEIENKDIKIYILNSGIGKVSSSITTSMVLNKYHIDKLISIGTSGALTTKTKIGDFIVGKRLAYHDVDVSAFGYELGQLPNHDKYFHTTRDSFWESVINSFKQVDGVCVVEGDIITGDKFVCNYEDKEFINKHFENGLCVEMESTAIIQTALAYNIDVYALRSISDNADTKADISFDQYLSGVCEKYKNLVEIILDNE